MLDLFKFNAKLSFVYRNIFKRAKDGSNEIDSF